MSGMPSEGVGQSTNDTPVVLAWLVVPQRGRVAVFLEKPLAEKYAVGVRGRLVPLGDITAPLAASR